MKRKSLYTMMAISSLVLAGTGVASAQSNTSGVLDRDDGIYLRCAMCGTVESITQNVGTQSSGGGSNTAATITGSVVGGLIGNRVGGGRGRRAATAAGVVAGGAVGSAAGNGNSSQPTTWTVRVRLGANNFMNVTVNDASDLRVGDTVEVDSNGHVTRLR
ncbi:MAG TPA: glycine zipper 2TM domain-containing protein [Lysobacter sp.]|nr:glycine zipper 2TM domain-containing protein [Lysobacter sp.]